MRTLTRIVAVALAAALAACSSSSSTPSSDTGFPQPAGTVAVNFKVEDQTHLYGNGDMVWKGSFTWDATTRKITHDSAWAGGVGPYPPLYDDGPWTAGGHEPAGSTAGDHILGITVFVTPPAATQVYEFGLHDPYYQETFGNGWIYLSTPGQFTINPGQTGTVDALATPFVISSGPNDLELVLDTALVDSTSFALSPVKVKTSALAWAEIPLTGSGPTYTFHLSDWAGAADKPYKHTGLLPSGAMPEFVWVLNGVEYKDANSAAIPIGVTAGSRSGTTGVFDPRTVQTQATGNKNTYVTIP